MVCLIAGIGIMTGPVPAATPPPAPPDLTQNPGIDHSRTYNLGATGMRGWIYTLPVKQFDLERLQGRTTQTSRQILVTHVGKASPADGVMQVDDVILGTGCPGDPGGREGIQPGDPETDPLARRQDRGRATQIAGHGNLQRHRAL